MSSRFKIAGAAVVGVFTVLGALAEVLGYVNLTPIGKDRTNVGYSFATPSPVGPMPKMPRCFEARGRGTPPDGKVFVVGSRGQDDTRTYFDHAENDPSTNEWSARFVVGSDESVGRTFRLRLVLVNAELAQYLASTNTEPGSTWWATVDLPPDAQEVAHLDIERITGEGCGR